MSRQGTHRITLVATVLNELAHLDEWLAGIKSQTRAPDEIIVVDGGSTDGTWERLGSWKPAVPVILIREPGVNIARGRNRAIERATGDIILVTDAGTRADPRWAERLVDGLVAARADVSGGFFVPIVGSAWEAALAATTLPDVDEIDPVSFLPSSRAVAFRKNWFDAGVRYPEWLDYCEDLVWGLALRRAGARFVFVPDALVAYRVRRDLASFARQYFRYARGDGKAGLFARRHAIRYATYSCLLVAIVRRRPLELLVAGIFGAVYLRRPLVRLSRRARGGVLPRRQVSAALLLAPCLRFAGDLAKMAGYPGGLVWRWKRYGGPCRRTSWRSISPAGELWPRGSRSSGSPTTTALPGDGFPARSR